MQGIPTAPPGAVPEKTTVTDPTVVRRTLKGAQVERITVENGTHRVTFNLLTDKIEEINFPSHPNGTLADLLNLVNRLVKEANYSVDILNGHLASLTM